MVNSNVGLSTTFMVAAATNINTAAAAIGRPL